MFDDSACGGGVAVRRERRPGGHVVFAARGHVRDDECDLRGARRTRAQAAALDRRERAPHGVDLVNPGAAGDEDAVRLAQVFERQARVARPLDHRGAAAGDEEDDEGGVLVGLAQQAERRARGLDARHVRQRVPARALMNISAISGTISMSGLPSA